MKGIYRDTRGRLGRHSWRLPRKLKKKWRAMVLERLLSDFGATLKMIRWRLHWVPLQGWTVTARERNLK